MGAPEQPPEDFLAETAEVHERNLRIGTRVFAGTTIMFFFAFAFAYFYLRSVDSNGQWNAEGVAPPDGFGIAITALLVLSAAAISYAARAARRRDSWLAAASLALAGGLAALVAQGFEYADPGFGPQSGGYASVFYGWTIMLAVIVLGAMYWLTALVAEGLRNRGRDVAVAPPGLDEAALYLRLLAGIAVFSWIVLYLI